MLPEKQSIDEEFFAFDQPDSIPFIDFWRYYLNFGYYLLLVPFRLVRKNDPESKKLEIRTCRVQKVLCGIIQSAILFQYVSLVWWSTRNVNGASQMSHFNSFCYASYIAYHFALNFTFWAKQDAFRLVLEHMQKLKFYDQKKEKRTVFWINTVSLSISVIALVMGMTDIYLVNSLYTNKSFTLFYEELQDRAKTHFLFADHIPLKELSPFKDFLLSVLTIVQVIILLPSVLLVPYLDLFVLMVPLCVRRIMKEFRQFCKNSMGSPVAAERILKKYATLRRFIKNLNRAMGVLICTCVCVSLPYYAAWIGVSFFENNVHPVMLIRVYAFFFIFFLALSLAADINKKGIEFYCWISSLENSVSISSKTISSLLMDLHSNQIALKGSAFFVITFRFLGTIFGVIVTYSIITIQLQFTRRANTMRSMLTTSFLPFSTTMEPEPEVEVFTNECICDCSAMENSTIN